MKIGFKLWKNKMDKIADAVKEVADEMVEKYEFLNDAYVVYSDRNNKEYLIDSFYQLRSEVIPNKTLRIFFSVTKKSVKESIMTPERASSFYRKLAEQILGSLKEDIERYQKIINRTPAGLV